MKFSYQYKTSGNEKREGVIAASSKEEVYRKLKAEGVHPFNVAVAPGLLNRVQQIGKRGLAIVILALVSVALAVALGRARSGVGASSPAQSTARHQLYGDPAVVEEMFATGFANVFTHPGERFLAYYAQPGRIIAIPKQLTAELFAPNAGIGDRFASCLTNVIALVEGEPPEHAEIKRMVNGLKSEMREYVAECPVREYVRRLDERQREEEMIYNRAVNELGNVSDPKLYEERNRALRELGLRTIPRQRTK